MILVRRPETNFNLINCFTMELKNIIKNMPPIMPPLFFNALTKLIFLLPYCIAYLFESVHHTQTKRIPFPHLPYLGSSKSTTIITISSTR